MEEHLLLVAAAANTSFTKGIVFLTGETYRFLG